MLITTLDGDDYHLVPDCTFQQLAWLRSHLEWLSAGLSWTQTYGPLAWTVSLVLDLEIPYTSPGTPFLVDGSGLEGTCSTALPRRPAVVPAAAGLSQGTGAVKALHQGGPQWTPGS